MQTQKRKTRAGSPPLGLGASLAVQFYQEDLAMVERLARDHRTSKGMILRNLVKQALEADIAMHKGAEKAVRRNG